MTAVKLQLDSTSLVALLASSIISTKALTKLEYLRHCLWDHM